MKKLLAVLFLAMFIGSKPCLRMGGDCGCPGTGSSLTKLRGE